jgi:PAS domain-containing protein
MKRTAYKPYVLPVLLIICTLFYYFGELIDWAAWNSLRASFFYGIHDVHRLLFLAPIVYAGYTARVKGAVIVTLISFIIFLPRAFFVSPYPDPLLRMILFTVFAGVIGILVGTIRNQTIKCQKMEISQAKERTRLQNIIDGLADGVIITDKEYRIRFMNSSMVKEYGQGAGFTCFQHMHKINEPCRGNCKLQEVINHRKIQHWKCELPGGKTYDITAAPYTDSDGTECQISVFRDMGQGDTTETQP